MSETEQGIRPRTQGEREQAEARRRYVLAAFRVKTMAMHELGILLKNSHIDTDTALDMFEEVKALHFR